MGNGTLGLKKEPCKKGLLLFQEKITEELVIKEKKSYGNYKTCIWKKYGRPGGFFI